MCIIEDEIKRISKLKEFNLDWPDSDRLRLCDIIVSEMQSNDVSRIKEWRRRLHCVTSKSAKFINDNQAFIVTGFGQLNE